MKEHVNTREPPYCAVNVVNCDICYAVYFLALSFEYFHFSSVVVVVYNLKIVLVMI